MTSLREEISRVIFLARYNPNVISEEYADEVISKIEKRIDELLEQPLRIKGYDKAIKDIKEILK